MPDRLTEISLAALSVGHAAPSVGVGVGVGGVCGGDGVPSLVRQRPKITDVSSLHYSNSMMSVSHLEGELMFAFVFSSLCCYYRFLSILSNLILFLFFFKTSQESENFEPSL